MEAPICNQTVPEGFLDALLMASHFKSRGTKNFPWLGFVELVNGKLYASDNRCIVEIDLGEDFGAARFSGGDIAVLKAMGDDPILASFNGASAFDWGDGRWYRAQTKTGSELSDRCQNLFDKYWHKGRDSKSAASAINECIAKLRATEKSTKSNLTGEDRKKFKSAKIVNILVDGDKQQWHIASIEKVMKVAKAYDPDANPAPFTFRNGRGLIVKPSQGGGKK